MKLKIIYDIEIDTDELDFSFSRSSGPGGQNVNKVNTRTELKFNVAESASLTEQQKQRILSRLANRIDKNSCIRVVAQKYRTQAANKNLAIDRFLELLTNALQRRTIRKKTKIPRSVVEKRLKDKRHRSILKKQRSERPELG